MMKKIIFSAVAVLMISGAALGGYAWHQQSQIDPMILANVEALSWDEGVVDKMCKGEKMYIKAYVVTMETMKYYHITDSYYYDAAYVETSKQCCVDGYGLGSVEGSQAFSSFGEVYKGNVICTGLCR